MRRKFSIALLVLSLLLSVATVALWVRSLTVLDGLGYGHATPVGDRYARTDWSVASALGYVHLERRRVLATDEPSSAKLSEMDARDGHRWFIGPVEGYDFSWNNVVPDLHQFGVSSGNELHGSFRHRWRSVDIPDWVLLVMLSPPWLRAIFRIYRARRGRRRAARTQCPSCGYDLRATPEDQSRYALNYASRFTADRGH